MLSCEDIGGFADRLCDLTVDMDDLQRIQEATTLLDEVESIAQRFLMQWRAASLADLHYLRGKSLREIAAAAGRSFQGASQWLARYGPTHYIVLAKNNGVIEVQVIQVEGQHTKTKVKQYRAAGRIVVPAVKNVYDPNTGTVRAGTDLGELWQSLTEPDS